MVKKLAAFAVSLLASVGFVVAVATPAHAAPCNPTFPANVLYLHDSADFCGGREAYSIGNMATNTCIYLGAPRPGNWAGSVYNKTNRSVILSDSINCTGSPSAGVAAFNMIYNLSSYSLYNKVSSVRVI
jgi:hypothetical protein